MNPIRKLTHLLFPAQCILCEQLLPGEEPCICPVCHTAASVFFHVPWKIPHVKQWFSLWAYQGAVRDSLIRYKFLRKRSYSTVYAREFAAKLCHCGFDYDVITWVPISPLRRLVRYFDQVELVAQLTAQHLEKPLVRSLYKQRHNRRQSRIRGKKARLQNVRGVYRIVDPEQIRGKRVLLIDDIITTGATVSEAARVLKEAGAKTVYAACLACSTNAQFRPD